jgi:hypothetical protein
VIYIPLACDKICRHFPADPTSGPDARANLNKRHSVVPNREFSGSLFGETSEHAQSLRDLTRSRDRIAFHKRLNTKAAPVVGWFHRCSPISGCRADRFCWRRYVYLNGIGPVEVYQNIDRNRALRHACGLRQQYGRDDGRSDAGRVPSPNRYQREPPGFPCVIFVPFN